MSDYAIEESAAGVEIVAPTGLRLTCASRQLAEEQVAFWTGGARAPVPRPAVDQVDPNSLYARRFLRQPEKPASRIYTEAGELVGVHSEL